jgi:hypothetical protein
MLHVKDGRVGRVSSYVRRRKASVDSQVELSSLDGQTELKLERGYIAKALQNPSESLCFRMTNVRALRCLDRIDVLD